MPPGVHQATVRGGAETVRDPAAAVVAGASATSGKWEATATLAAFCPCRVRMCPCAPVSPQCLLPCPDVGDTAVTALPGASCPAPWLQRAWIPCSARGWVPSWCTALIASPPWHWCVCALVRGAALVAAMEFWRLFAACWGVFELLRACIHQTHPAMLFFMF